MSRRHLTFAVAALASLVVTACSSSPMAPEPRVKSPTTSAADLIAPPPKDTTGRSGWMGSSG